jgi:hypothetical protein
MSKVVTERTSEAPPMRKHPAEQIMQRNSGSKFIICIKKENKHICEIGFFIKVLFAQFKVISHPLSPL